MVMASIPSLFACGIKVLHTDDRCDHFAGSVSNHVASKMPWWTLDLNQDNGIISLVSEQFFRQWQRCINRLLIRLTAQELKNFSQIIYPEIRYS